MSKDKSLDEIRDEMLESGGDGEQAPLFHKHPNVDGEGDLFPGFVPVTGVDVGSEDGSQTAKVYLAPWLDEQPSVTDEESIAELILCSSMKRQQGAKTLAEIKARVLAAMPDKEFDTPTSILGSGQNLCTAVVFENSAGRMDFFADIYPDYAQQSDEYAEIGSVKHSARLVFLENVFADMMWLISNLEEH